MAQEHDFKAALDTFNMLVEHLDLGDYVSAENTDVIADIRAALELGIKTQELDMPG
jgi:hypothetical protein